MQIECEAEVTPLGLDGELVAMSPAARFEFIITIGAESLSCSVEPSTLAAGRSNRVRLRFLVPEAVQAIVHAGAAFEFFDRGKRGIGRILEVVHA